MFRKSNVGKINRLKRSAKAISPVIAALLMIAITVVASLVAYAWITGYVGVTTSKAGKAIQIQSYATDPSTGNLVVYVQNVGQGAVQIKPDGSVYVNNVLQTVTGTELIPISPGQTVPLVISSYPWTTGNEVKVKVVTVDGTFMEVTGTGYGSLTTPTSIFSDGFENGDISAWTGTEGPIPTVQSSIRNSGSYATAASTSVDVSYSDVYKDLGSDISTPLYFRYYVKFTALPSSSGDTTYIGWFGTEYLADTTAAMTLYNDAGIVKFRLAFDESLTSVISSSSPAINTWYCIELEFYRGTNNNDGLCQAWINGVLAASITGINTSVYGRYVQVGVWNYIGGVSTTVYTDDVVVASSYI